MTKWSNDLLITLTETSPLRQDEWPAGGDIKWSQQEWNPRQRCSDLGEALDSGGDAAERCQLVLGGRHRGEPQTLLTDMNYRRFCISFLHAVSFEIMKCVALSVMCFCNWWFLHNFPFFTSQLFLFLQDFSQKMLSKTHEIEKQLDSLIRDTKATDSCLHSVFNDFLMLSNTQFIENVIHHTGTFFFHFCYARCTTTTVTNLSLHVRASHTAAR